jgi:hypothetical protein
MAPLQPWHDFFLLTGTAAATLLGLVFVAGSIAATIPNEKLGDASNRAIWVLPIVYAFIRVLAVSAVGLIPAESPRTFGGFLALFAILDLGRMVWVTRGMVRAQRTGLEQQTLGDWFWYVIYPCAATTSLGVTGAVLVASGPLLAATLAIGLIAHLVIGVHNAWELTEWLATRT